MATQYKYPQLAEGKNGDWKKEGYKLSHSYRSNGVDVYVHSKEGVRVGNLSADHSSRAPNTLYARGVDVEDEHLRKGIATAMYDHARKVTGRKFVTGRDQSEDGKAFRSKYDARKQSKPAAEPVVEVKLGDATVTFGDRAKARYKKVHHSIDSIQHEKPLTIPFHRKTFPPAPNMGGRFGQDVEPHGEYMSYGHGASASYDTQHGEKLISNQVNGTVRFKKPYVVTDTENYTWKHDLASKLGKKGRSLSTHLQKKGYDGIVVLPSKGKVPTEMVNLSGKKTVHEAANLSERDGTFDYASTQVNFPRGASKIHQAFAYSIIDPNDLASHGFETQPHATLKYGLHHDDPEPLKRLLAHESPFTAHLGVTKVFPANEQRPDSDCVVLTIDSPDMHRLNRKIKEAYPHTDTYPTYDPHCTVAYVKAGLGKKYEGLQQMKGTPITFNSVALSSKSGEQQVIPLGLQSVSPSAAQDRTVVLKYNKPKLS